ncbi:PEP-CTERM sorting domain-containing protein [Aquabacterium sp.]|uniref:PEP-CTERM sorting domain-containing protein n=1 Tax=Aquabacterium sp. TaxID=1872578 RepID=UPI002E375779|nr:PEP-CTERM sorting domain-containing protein [Aquabacterium sp.]HEX5311086.1 PEP-CTERM sorting domain-containing protein [Aquabacterium sp.]
MTLRKSLPLTRLAVALAASLAVNASQAVEFTLSGATADTWTYTLTYNPLDNYAIPGLATEATIRLTGLAGVVSATGPVSTDFVPDAPFLDTINLNWTAQVLNGGTEVLWTHVGPGTGNFDVDKHVFGFSVFAPGATAGAATFQTTGFSTDVSFGSLSRDVRGQVVGPTAAVPEPESWALALIGVATVGGVLRRRRQA